jgi:hypothetical protein
VCPWIDGCWVSFGDRLVFSPSVLSVGYDRYRLPYRIITLADGPLQRMQSLEVLLTTSPYELTSGRGPKWSHIMGDMIDYNCYQCVLKAFCSVVFGLPPSVSCGTDRLVQTEEKTPSKSTNNMAMTQHKA